MEALYFGSANGGENHGGAGAGPWIMADMENALWVRHQLWLFAIMTAPSSFD